MKDPQFEICYDGTPLTSAERDVLRQMFFQGPVWDGDLTSKLGRSGLISKGLVARFDGWQALTVKGMELAVQVGLGSQKEAWENKRRHASLQREKAVEFVRQFAARNPVFVTGYHKDDISKAQELLAELDGDNAP